ncbi:hypothetical protein HDU93_003813 [Gonapodya sp. JEL0774]|nr:hypothetical protein HDU93_003813 [Gonapodya sp. JEL0774]
MNDIYDAEQAGSTSVGYEMGEDGDRQGLHTSYLPSPAPSNTSSSSTETRPPISQSRGVKSLSAPRKPNAVDDFAGTSQPQPQTQLPKRRALPLETQQEKPASSQQPSTQANDPPKQKTLKRSAPGANPGVPVAPSRNDGPVPTKKPRPPALTTTPRQPQQLPIRQSQNLTSTSTHMLEGSLVPFQPHSSSPAWGWPSAGGPNGGSGGMLPYGGPGGLTSNLALAMAADIRNQEDRRREEEERVRRNEELKGKAELLDQATRLRARIAHLELRLREASRARDRCLREAMLACTAAEGKQLPPSRPGEGCLSESVSIVKEETDDRVRLETLCKSALAKLRPLQKQVEDAQRMFLELEKERQKADTRAYRAKASEDRAKLEEEALAHEVEKLDRKCHALIDRLGSSKKSFEIVRKKLTTNLEQRVAELGKQLESSERKLAESQNKFEKLSVEAERTRSELETYRSELANSEKSIQDLKIKLESDIQAKIKEISQLEINISSLKTAGEETASQITKLKNESHVAVQTRDDQIGRLSVETEQLRHEKQILEAEIRKLGEEAKASADAAEIARQKELKEQKSRFQSAKEALEAQHSTALNGVKTEVAELHRLLEEERKAKREVETTVERKNFELEKIKVELDEQKAAAKLLITEDAVKTRVDDAVKARTQELCSYQTREINKKDEELRAKAKRIEELMAGALKMNATLSNLGSEAQTLRTNVSEKDKLLQDMQQEISRLRDIANKLEDTQRDAYEARQDAAKAQQETCEAKAELEKLQEKLCAAERATLFQQQIQREIRRGYPSGPRNSHPATPLNDAQAEAAASQSSEELIEGLGLLIEVENEISERQMSSDPFVVEPSQQQHHSSQRFRPITDLPLTSNVPIAPGMPQHPRQHDAMDETASTLQPTQENELLKIPPSHGPILQRREAPGRKRKEQVLTDIDKDNQSDGGGLSARARRRVGRQEMLNVNKTMDRTDMDQRGERAYAVSQQRNNIEFDKTRNQVTRGKMRKSEHRAMEEDIDDSDVSAQSTTVRCQADRHAPLSKGPNMIANADRSQNASNFRGATPADAAKSKMNETAVNGRSSVNDPYDLVDMRHSKVPGRKPPAPPPTSKQNLASHREESLASSTKIAGSERVDPYGKQAGSSRQPVSAQDQSRAAHSTRRNANGYSSRQVPKSNATGSVMAIRTVAQGSRPMADTSQQGEQGDWLFGSG